MSIKDRCYKVLDSLNGSASEAQLAQRYMDMYPDYDKNYTDTPTSSRQKLKGSISSILIRKKGHKKIKVNRNKKPREYYIVNYISTTPYPEEVTLEESKSIIEGAKKQVTVNKYERSSKARKKCLKKYGYKCFICEFDFDEIYGEIGKDFIHVHHLKEISSIAKSYKIDPIKDLRPVCPNCHAMLHKKNPAYTIEELKDILEENS